MMKQATVKKGKIKLAGIYYSKGEALTGADDVINRLCAAGLVDNVSVVETETSSGDNTGDANLPSGVPSKIEKTEAVSDTPPVTDDGSDAENNEDDQDADIDDAENGQNVEDAQVTLDPNDVVVEPAKTVKSTKKG